MKNKFSDPIKSFSFHIKYFLSHFGNFCRHFWRLLYFCDNNGPLPKVIIRALYFKHSFLNWILKFNEMTECLQNCRFYRTMISNSTMVIAKIKEMPTSSFYVIPCYVTMDYEKWYTSLLLKQCEEIRAFEVQNHANYM